VEIIFLSCLYTITYEKCFFLAGIKSEGGNFKKGAF